MKKTKLSLQPSEGLVFQAASTIYAAYIQSGRIPAGREQEWMDRALREAIQLAQQADRQIQSDSEMD